jgi:hypothetical protein
VLAVPPRRQELGALQAVGERSGRETAENARIADDDAVDRLASSAPCDDALEGFDVGQFQHYSVRPVCARDRRLRLPDAGNRGSRATGARRITTVENPPPGLITPR